jgi:hypothetical protein
MQKALHGTLCARLLGDPARAIAFPQNNEGF